VELLERAGRALNGNGLEDKVLLCIAMDIEPPLLNVVCSITKHGLNRDIPM
jgi:hypothetical protein